MTTNPGITNLIASSGARHKIKMFGAVATIIVAIVATAAPASANSLGSRQKANKTASMIHQVHVANLRPVACCYAGPLILGTGF